MPACGRKGFRNRFHKNDFLFPKRSFDTVWPPQRGVDVHVCPICMKALNVEESVLMKGAKVTTRPGLFANICAKAAVLTY